MKISFFFFLHLHCSCKNNDSATHQRMRLTQLLLGNCSYYNNDILFFKHLLECCYWRWANKNLYVVYSDGKYSSFLFFSVIIAEMGLYFWVCLIYFTDYSYKVLYFLSMRLVMYFFLNRKNSLQMKISNFLFCFAAVTAVGLHVSWEENVSDHPQTNGTWGHAGCILQQQIYLPGHSSAKSLFICIYKMSQHLLFIILKAFGKHIYAVTSTSNSPLIQKQCYPQLKGHVALGLILRRSTQKL